MPFTSFCEPDQVGGSLQPVWFALSPERPLAFLAGVCKRDHSCVARLVKEGEVTCDLFSFLTTGATSGSYVDAFRSLAVTAVQKRQNAYRTRIANQPCKLEPKEEA